MSTVRDATPEDAGDIARIHVASWQVTYVGIFPDEYLASMDVESRTLRWRTDIEAGESQVLVVEDPSGRVVGFSSAMPDPDEPGKLGVRTMYLDPDTTGRGDGRALMEAVVARIASLGFGETYLDVDTGNTQAIGFYEHMGWQSDGVARPFTIGELSSTVYRYTLTLETPTPGLSP